MCYANTKLRAKTKVNLLGMGFHDENETDEYNGDENGHCKQPTREHSRAKNDSNHDDSETI